VFEEVAEESLLVATAARAGLEACGRCLDEIDLRRRVGQCEAI